MDIRRKFVTQRVVTHWNRLPKVVVDAPSLEALKARLDAALDSLVWWLVTLHIAGGLKLDNHCDPFQPRPFCDSMILGTLRFVGLGISVRTVLHKQYLRAYATNFSQLWLLDMKI